MFGFLIIYRLRKSGQIGVPAYKYMFGFLWRGLKPGYVYLRQVDSLISVLLVVELAVQADSSTIIMCICYLIKFLYVFEVQPFEKKATNGFWLTVGFCTVVYTLYLLVISAEYGQFALALTAVLVGLMRLIVKRTCPEKYQQWVNVLKCWKKDKDKVIASKVAVEIASHSIEKKRNHFKHGSTLLVDEV